VGKRKLLPRDHNGSALNYSGESSDAGLAVSDGDLLRCDYGV